MVQQGDLRSGYGPETSEVQFAVGPIDGPLGTIIRGGRRLATIKYRNVGDEDATIKVQESAALGGAASWSDIAGSSILIKAGGISPEINIRGLAVKDFIRLFGSTAGAAGTVIRAELDDLDMLDNFRQTAPYGVG